MASPYLTLATDGTDLGANMALITELTTVAQTGDRRSVTETRYSGGWLTYNGVQRVQYPSTLINSDLPAWSALSALPRHTVSSDAQLRALLDGGSLTTGGHVIVVDHTVTYTGDYFGRWPVRSAGDQVPGGTNCCFFVSKAIWDSMLANAGVSLVCPEKKRVTSADLANLCTFKAVGASTIGQFSVSATLNGLAVATHGFRFIGFRLSVDPACGYVSHLAQFGTGDGAVQNKVAQCPSNMGWDRCVFDGHGSCDIRHAIELHCRYGYVVDCSAGPDIHVQYNSESHVVCGYNGPGPFRIVNNSLNGGSQSIFFGGEASPCGMPSDIETRYNICTRPLSWMGGPWKVKCGIESKKAARWLIEGNIIENTWLESQVGATLLLKSESYGDAATVGTTRDILARANLIRNTPFGINIASPAEIEPLTQAQYATRVISFGNLYLIGGSGLMSASPNPCIGAYASNDSGSIHDTFVSAGGVNAVSFTEPGSATRFVIRDSIFGATSVGIKASALLEGTDTITNGMPSADIQKNALTGRSSGSYPAGNFFPANEAAIQFTNAAAKDYSLLGTTQTSSGGATQPVTPVATSLRIKTQPSGGVSGSPLTTQPVIDVLDQFGAVVNSTATITATSDSGAVSDTNNTMAAVAGTAPFTNLTGTAASTAATTWTFSSPGLASVTSDPVSITVAVAARVATGLRVVTQPAGAVSGQALTQQPVVEVIDQYGDRIASTATITASAHSATSGNTASVAAGGSVAAVGGVATFTALGVAATVDGSTELVRFSSAGLPDVDSATFVVALFVTPTPTPDPATPPPPEPPPSTTPEPVPAQLVCTREPGPAGRLYSRKRWAQQPIVEARNADGTLMTSYNGLVTVYTTSEDVLLRGTKTVTAIGGVARWSDLSAVGAGPLDLNFVDGPHT